MGLAVGLAAAALLSPVAGDQLYCVGSPGSAFEAVAVKTTDCPLQTVGEEGETESPRSAIRTSTLSTEVQAPLVTDTV